jgi:hypothetical protein
MVQIPLTELLTPVAAAGNEVPIASFDESSAKLSAKQWGSRCHEIQNTRRTKKVGRPRLSFQIAHQSEMIAEKRAPTRFHMRRTNSARVLESVVFSI